MCSPGCFTKKKPRLEIQGILEEKRSGYDHEHARQGMHSDSSWHLYSGRRVLGDILKGFLFAFFLSFCGLKWLKSSHLSTIFVFKMSPYILQSSLRGKCMSRTIYGGAHLCCVACCVRSKTCWRAIHGRHTPFGFDYLESGS